MSQMPSYMPTNPSNLQQTSFYKPPIPEYTHSMVSSRQSLSTEKWVPFTQDTYCSKTIICVLHASYFVGNTRKCHTTHSHHCPLGIKLHPTPALLQPCTTEQIQTCKDTRFKTLCPRSLFVRAHSRCTLEAKNAEIRSDAHWEHSLYVGICNAEGLSLYKEALTESISLMLQWHLPLEYLSIGVF